MVATSEVYVEPSVITVALADEMLVLCHEVLAPAGLRVHRVAHVHAACERIAVLLPQLVVVPASMRPDEVDMIEDRTIAVGALLLTLDAGHGYDAMAAQLEVTLADVRRRFGRGRFEA